MDDDQSLPRQLFGVLTSPLEDDHPTASVERVVAELRQGGATDALVYLVDLDQAELRPAPALGTDSIEPIPIDGLSPPGRCYRTQTTVTVGEAAETVTWVPLCTRGDRLGVMGLRTSGPPDAAFVACGEEAARTLSLLMSSEYRYTDDLARARRRQPLSLPAEIQWNLLPPLAFTGPGVALAGLLAPAYGVGGDVFDYALNGSVLHFAVLDGMGHGIEASLLATLAINAYRNARRGGADLVETHQIIDQSVAAYFAEKAFVTGLFGRLDTVHGSVTWVAGGHPPPLLIRDGNPISELTAAPALPFGFGPAEARVNEVVLEPGDQILCYTDGVTEARAGRPDEPWGIERLRRFVRDEADRGELSSETLRQVVSALLEHSGGNLIDDATLLLMRWTGASPSGTVAASVSKLG
ncbi:MAG: PP2C family protein-serine/threonine phosphatase [Acidimicrobiales bacterium]